MKHLFLIKAYLKYWLKAKSAHGTHSPFVYDFIKNIVEDKRHFYAFDEIKNLRKTLYQNIHVVEVEDFGAGSLLSASTKRRISDIAKNAGRNEVFGKILFRMVNHYQLKNIIELGTSLGIGTSYLAMANQQANIQTIEGSKNIAQEARKNLAFLAIKNVTQHIGQFDDLLLPMLQQQSFDLLFVDGNHRKEPTLKYFKMALPFIHENSIMIFDDIHWSAGMQEAWEEIKNHSQVTYSLDLFYFGIVFFKQDFKEKQDFVLKFK